MRARAVAVASGLVLALSWAPLGAGAASAPAWGRALSAVEAEIAPLRADVATLRRTLAEGSVFSAVRAAAFAAHHTEALRGLRSQAAPRSLRQAELALTSAVARAGAIVRNSEASKLGRRLGLNRVARLLARATAFAIDGHWRPGVAAPSSAPALRAAAVVARAVDASMPALRRAAASRSGAGRAASGCDLLDQSNICVGGVGDNVFTADEELIVDLGGNDTYRNNAGGAPNATLQPVALVVDVSGNDTYAAPSTEFMSQGGGGVGDVGMLIDPIGDDTYSIVNDAQHSRSGGVGVSLSASAGAQGQGDGAVGGVGVFLDGAGNDTYRMTSTVTGASAGCAGHGEGFLGGSGTFVDGAGNDTYSLQARSLPKAAVLTDDDGNETPITQYGSVGIAAQGFGFFAGAGLFSDGGGTDSFSDTATLVGSPPDADPVYMPGAAPNLPNAAVTGQGVGVFAGAAFFLEGVGTTTYTNVATAEPTPTQVTGVMASVLGQGAGAIGSAVMSDAGGDDTYSNTATTESSVARTAVDGCIDCGGEVDSVAGVVNLDVDGWGGAGTGLLDDASGNDTFTATGSNRALLELHDARTTAGGAPFTGTATSSPVLDQAQGYGTAGSGVLWSAGGDDSYVTSVTSSAEANGTAADASLQPQVASSAAGPAVTVQGSATGGQGAIVDLGGSDTYRASGGSTQTVNGSTQPGPVELDVQGAVQAAAGQASGLAVDLDGIGTDVYTQSPADPACQGTRGQAVWQDCGQVGLGVNA
ncbi:MAG: hypothetical protein ABR600_03515 [Actinomycetota bacterium]